MQFSFSHPSLHDIIVKYIKHITKKYIHSKNLGKFGGKKSLKYFSKMIAITNITLNSTDRLSYPNHSRYANYYVNLEMRLGWLSAIYFKLTLFQQRLDGW